MGIIELLAFNYLRAEVALNDFRQGAEDRSEERRQLCEKACFYVDRFHAGSGKGLAVLDVFYLNGEGFFSLGHGVGVPCSLILTVDEPMNGCTAYRVLDLSGKGNCGFIINGFVGGEVFDVDGRRPYLQFFNLSCLFSSTS